MLDVAVWAPDDPAPPPAVQAAPTQAAAPPASGEPPSSAIDLGGVVIVAPRPTAVEPAWMKSFNFDVRSVYAPTDTRYLRQRPVDGCKLMAGGASSLIGEAGAAGGMVCAKRF